MKLKEFLKSNYKNLTYKEVEDLAVKIQALLPNKRRRLSEVKAGEKFNYKGYEFTKLADEEKSCYCLFNKSVFESKFGETNNWAESPIRKRLNSFNKNGASEVMPNIVKDDLVEIELNYYSYKNLNGRVADRLTLLSYEEWCTYYYESEFNIAGINSWLRSGYYSNALNACNLSASGNGNSNDVTFAYAVRPALHIRKDIEVEI